MQSLGGDQHGCFRLPDIRPGRPGVRPSPSCSQSCLTGMRDLWLILALSTSIVAALALQAVYMTWLEAGAPTTTAAAAVEWRVGRAAEPEPAAASMEQPAVVAALLGVPADDDGFDLTFDLEPPADPDLPDRLNPADGYVLVVDVARAAAAETAPQ